VRRVRFVFILSGGAAVLLTALAFTARRATAGSRGLQGEHEAIVYRGITACGVERWSIKVRRALALFDCL
jgi:hypothetical protein